jgi:hypothetical protein
VAWSITSRIARRSSRSGGVAGLGEPGPQLDEDLLQRLDGPLERDDLPGQLVDAPRHVRVAAEDLHLDLVDVVLQAVEDGEVVVDDPVQHRVEHRHRAVREQVRVALQPVADLTELRLGGVPDGDDEVRAEEQVHLADLDDLVGVDVAGRAQHHELGAAVALQLGALVGVDGVLDRQRVQPELRRDLVDLVDARPQHADPAERGCLAAVIGTAALQRLDRAVDGVGRRCPLAVDVDRVVDHRHADSWSCGPGPPLPEGAARVSGRARPGRDAPVLVRV